MKATLNREARTTAALLVLMLVLLVSYSYSKDSELTLRGAIEDSQCAFNVHSEGHSHDWMIKKHVAGARDAKSCTLHCVRDMGGKYVLVVKDDVYRFDNESAAEPFAGMKVKITGTLLDAKTQTVHIVSIVKE